MIAGSETVVLSKRAQRAIQRELVSSDEFEKCGFLLGRRLSQEIRVENIRPAKNIYQHRDSFAIGSQEYAAVLIKIDSAEELVGIYHTHNGAARIGHHDRINLVLHSFPWLIVGIRGEMLEWRCFKHDCGRIKQLYVRFEELKSEGRRRYQVSADVGEGSVKSRVCRTPLVGFEDRRVL